MVLLFLLLVLPSLLLLLFLSRHTVGPFIALIEIIDILLLDFLALSSLILFAAQFIFAECLRERLGKT